MSSATSRFDSEKVHIPNYWSEDTQTCIEEGVLDDESKSDICRTLVTLLVSKHGSKPGRVRCEEIARQLILKYPFMKDDIGNGYVRCMLYTVIFEMFYLLQASWVSKMKECLDNRIKQARRKMKQTCHSSPNPKRQRITNHKDELIHRSVVM